jgi:hypothetical protein
MALQRELVFLKNSRARHRKAYLARVKTPKLAIGKMGRANTCGDYCKISKSGPF